jgi:hypothetical protein
MSDLLSRPTEQAKEMSESNAKPVSFRLSLREWQERFQARRALIAELKGTDTAPAEDAPPAPLREKKLLPRKRLSRGAAAR